MGSMEELFGEPIAVYTRRQAIADGFLVDLTDQARGVGFKIPVAITHAAYETAIAMTPAAKRAGCDVAGRTHDVLWMLLCAIRASRSSSTRLSYSLRVVRSKRRPELVELASVCGPGDDAAPVLTIMLPDED